MPANRRPVDRQAKRDEIVRVAAELFTDVGFEAAPMTQLAAAAGVTTNTVYWYFEDKDALLVAVLDLLLAEALQEYEQHDGPLHEQLQWAVSRLERFHKLVSVVHNRTASSSAVAAWHEQFHGLADAMLADGFRRAGVAESDLAAASRIGTLVVEGLLTHPQDEPARDAVLHLLTTLAPPIRIVPTGQNTDAASQQ
jgi:AcrR family transcriptional regulator